MVSTKINKAINLSAGHLFSIARSAYGSIQNVEPPTTGNQDASLVAIVFSAASLEAFFNEILELASMFPIRTNDPPALHVYVKLAEEIESNKGSMKLKFIFAYSILSGKPCDKGGQPYQDFALLIEARNGLMHMRPMDFLGEIKSDGTEVFEPAPIVEKFRSKGIVENQSSDNRLPWHTRIATPAAAKWACNTAANVVGTIINAFPDSSPDKLALREIYGKDFVPLA